MNNAILVLPGGVTAPQRSPRSSPTASTGGRHVNLAHLWEELRAGTKRVVRHHYADGCCHVVLRRPEGGARPTPRGVAAVESALLGNPLKFRASEQGVAVSTISVQVGECLKSMGLDPSPARAPMVCAMAVHAHRGLVRLPPARVEIENGDEVVSVSRPDTWLKSCLAPAEAQVASLRLEGFTGTHIATLRGTSARTVANQLSVIFGKFGVSGRGELLSLVVRISASLWGGTAPSLESTADRVVSALRESSAERLSTSA